MSLNPPDAEHVARARFAQALAEVQNITKSNTADTGKYTYSYADLGDVLAEVKRALQIHGLTVTQWPSVNDQGMMTVGCMILHADSRSVFELPPLAMRMPGDAQAFGSALTYARRYQLLTIFGIAPEDDDGKAATVAATVQPGRRSEAERMIRELIAELTPDMRARFTTDFKATYGSSLTDLPLSRHGDALTWSRTWVQQPADEPETTDAP